MLEIVQAAIDELCVAFDDNGYNPTPIIDLGVLVVIADGNIDLREREVLRGAFQSLLDTKLSAEVVDHLVTASVDVVGTAGAESRARLIAEILVDCGAVEPGILVALAIAFASEGLSREERAVIEKIADHARFPRARLEQLIGDVAARAERDPASVRSLLSNGS